MKTLIITAKDYRNRKARNNYWEISDELAEAIKVEYNKAREQGKGCPISSDGDNRMDIDVSILDENLEIVFGWRSM